MTRLSNACFALLHFHTVSKKVEQAMRCIDPETQTIFDEQTNDGQGGAAQEAQHIDAYAWSSPDRLLCHNPLHAGNLRQTLWGGIRGWTIQVAVRVSEAPQTWQWQTLSPAHTGEAIAALRVCWRTSPESTTAWAGLEGGTTALACALPSSPGPVRDRWQLIARWHGQRPVL